MPERVLCKNARSGREKNVCVCVRERERERERENHNRSDYGEREREQSVGIAGISSVDVDGRGAWRA